MNVKHGLRQLEQALKKNQFDGRSKTAWALRAWEQKLIDMKGGREQCTVAQLMLITECARLKVLLDNMAKFVLMDERQQELKEQGMLPPIVHQGVYATYQNALDKHLAKLGIERKEVEKEETLSDYLSKGEAA